jgi:dihydrofolate synthase/folylpolyglutamate synthase
VRDRLRALETFGIKLGLENITRLCAALGHPERQFTSLHVAGTNGKGSVTAFTHAALRAAGIRAARYTSPHLVDLRERFVIDDDAVDEETLSAVGTHVLDLADRMVASGDLAAPPTYFEATTAIGFELFRRAGVQVAVVEVGLGGRFDSTNIVTPPVGAITSIALDHQQYLGDTLKAIAFEKAGIIKPGMTVVTGQLPVEADAVVSEVAADRGAAVVAAMWDTRVDVEMQDGRARLTVRTPVASYGPITLGLRGAHQVANAVVAIRLLEAAGMRGIVVPGPAVAQGLANARWPGRLELLPIGGDRAVLLDAAHNVEGAQALAAYLATWHPERPPLVVGVMGDKDADGILSALLPVTSAVITTEATTSRALPAGALAERVRHLDGSRSVTAEPACIRAVERALADAPLACVAGSIYLVGEVRDALERRAILH